MMMSLGKTTPLYYVKWYSYETKWAFIWLLLLHIIEGYVFDRFIKTLASKKTVEKNKHPKTTIWNVD